jgi:TolB-like protein
LFTAIAVLGGACARAQDSDPAAPAAAAVAAPAAAPLTVAVLPFDTTGISQERLGQDLASALTAVLSTEPKLQMVERAQLEQALRELELNLTGAVDAAQAARIGKLVGARILVTGRVFPLDKKIMAVAKIIGVETSLVEGVLVSTTTNQTIDELFMITDPLPALKERLADRQLPIVAVVCTERHLSGRERAAPDPAVETEIKKMLIDCGFMVQDVKANALTQWAKQLQAHNAGAWPQDLEKVQYVVAGEAFSEFAARIGTLVSCNARAEVNLISREDGRIVLASRTDRRAVDLSEQIAAKRALEATGRTIGLEILGHFANTAPKKD